MQTVFHSVICLDPFIPTNPLLSTIVFLCFFSPFFVSGTFMMLQLSSTHFLLNQLKLVE